MNIIERLLKEGTKQRIACHASRKAANIRKELARYVDGRGWHRAGKLPPKSHNQR